MTDERIIVEKMIDKFRFDEPVSSDVRKYIAVSKKKNLKSILKNEKTYGIFTGLALGFFLLARKAGLTLSFVQAAVVAGAVTTVAAAVIITGAVKGASVLIEMNKPHTKISAPPAVIQEEKPVVENAVTLTVIKFTGSDNAKSAAAKAGRVLLRELSIKKQDIKVVQSLHMPDSGNVITGTVDEMNGIYIITVKTIDASKGIVSDIQMIEAKNETEINSACAVLAGKIIKNIK